MIQSGYRDATTSFGSPSNGLSQMKSGAVVDVPAQLVALGAPPAAPYAPPAAAPPSYPPPAPPAPTDR